jgi:hypothetical protein
MTDEQIITNAMLREQDQDRIELLEDLLERSLPLLRGHVHGGEMVERIRAALEGK